MWRNVGRHTYRDSGGTVYQKIRITGRKYRRLFFCFIKVRSKVHGIFIDIRKHLHGNFTQTRLSISHGSRAVSIHRTEVSMAVNQRITGGPVLCHINQGSIDRTVTVRMIFTHGITNDTCAFSVWFIRTVVQFNHREQYSSLYRL